MTEAVLHLRHLTKDYGSKVGIEDLDLDVYRGEVFGFLGPNGAGKSTTLRLLLDLIRPTRGEIRVLGQPPGDAATRARIGYLPGELALDPRLTGAATLELLARLQGLGAARRVPRFRELTERFDLTGSDLGRRVHEYSRGMKQKIGLIAAFLGDPDLLILDEPTSGLDPLARETTAQLMKAAQQEGRTVFHSSHILSEVDRTCSRIGIVREARLVALGTREELHRDWVRRVKVRFASQVPVDRLEVEGVTVKSHDGRVAELTVGGNLGPVLRRLSELPVEDLSMPEPRLEDTFAAYYSTERAS